MINQKFRYAVGVFIGRFQPFHYGHLATVELALTYCETVVIVLGSYLSAPSVRAPWSAQERKKMILACLPESAQRRIRFLAVRDRLYCEKLWVEDIVTGVSLNSSCASSVALVGHEKDASSYYLKIFPSWDFVETGSHGPLNATAVRWDFFTGDGEIVRKHVPFPVWEWLEKFRGSKNFLKLQEEFLNVRKHQSLSLSGDLPPQLSYAFLCWGSYILLEHRDKSPGKDLLSLPVMEEVWLQEENWTIKEFRYTDDYGSSSKIYQKTLTNQLEIFSKTTTDFYLKIGYHNRRKWILYDDLLSQIHLFYRDHYQIIQWFLRYQYLEEEIF